MAFSAAAFGAAAITAAGAILKFESENVLNDGPSALLEPNPGGAVASVAQAIARQSCRRYADDPSGLAESFSVNMEVACRPYLDNIGYGQGPQLKKPFEGGQCAGVAYRLQGTLTWDVLICSTGGVVANSEPASTEIIFIGPIVSITPRYFDPGACGNRSFTFDVVHDGGNQTSTAFFKTNATNRSFNAKFSGSALDATGVGGPCGSPPPELIDPVPPPTPGPDTEPYNPGPDIDIDITVNLTPDSLIEVNLGLGPVLINPFGGGGDGGGGEPGLDPDTSPPAPEPGPELPGGNGGFGGDDGFGPPPAGRRWVGCCITITDTPQNASAIPGSEPEDVYPSVIGNIRLVFDAAGNRQTDTPIRILAKYVCVWEPVQKLNPIGVNVDLLPGYGYTYRPFSVPSGD